MKPLKEFSLEARRRIVYVLTDIDDTMTTDGRLTAEAYGALERLHSAGLKVLPITGRPAGWCDMIARFWPVDGVVGENGAFYFHYQANEKKMLRRYWKTVKSRLKDQANLARIRDRILAEVPGVRVASDQAYREADLAIDFCEDVPPRPIEDVERVVDIFLDMGAQAKISSIHVNGWFGGYDKLSMTRMLFSEVFDVELDEVKDLVVFAGDSPNDAPMFGYFPNAVGVANLMDFEDRLEARPAWITNQPFGQGFRELADSLLEAKSEAT